jgi:hypothetical protein
MKFKVKIKCITIQIIFLEFLAFPGSDVAYNSIKTILLYLNIPSIQRLESLFFEDENKS